MRRSILLATLVVVVAGRLAAAQPAPTQATDAPPPAPVASTPSTINDPMMFLAARIPDPVQVADQGATDTANALDDLPNAISDFDKLRTPASPAFAILGVSPADIQRPTTPRALALALGQFVDGGVGKSFALEVSPFWLVGHPGLTLEDYQAESWARPLRTFSVSVGTQQTPRIEDAGGVTTTHTDSDLGLGVHSILYQSQFSKDCLGKVAAYDAAVDEAAHLSNSDIAKLEQTYGKNTDAYKKAARELQSRQVTAKSDSSSAAKALLTSPACVADATSMRGVTIDVAGALDLLATDSKLTAAETSWHRAAAWANVGWDGPHVSAVAMARFAAEKDASTQKVADAGIRGIYKAHSVAFSAEALARYRLDVDSEAWTYRADVALEDEVTDGVWLSVSFGKGFTFTPDDAGSLFSLANLQWNLGKATIGN